MGYNLYPFDSHTLPFWTLWNTLVECKIIFSENSQTEHNCDCLFCFVLFTYAGTQHMSACVAHYDRSFQWIETCVIQTTWHQTEWTDQHLLSHTMKLQSFLKKKHSNKLPPSLHCLQDYKSLKHTTHLYSCCIPNNLMMFFDPTTVLQLLPLFSDKKFKCHKVKT